VIGEFPLAVWVSYWVTMENYNSGRPWTTADQLRSSALAQKQRPELDSLCAKTPRLTSGAGRTAWAWPASEMSHTAPEANAMRSPGPVNTCDDG
jgi:hypothetical protein